MAKKLGEKIRDLRRANNLSQEALASTLGVTFQAVSKWENSTTMPDVGLIPAIAHFFGISIDELFDYNTYENEQSIDKLCKVLLNALLELNLLTEKSVQQAGDVLQEAASAMPVYWPEDEEHIAKETDIEWETFELYTRWTDKSYPLTLKHGTDEDGVIYRCLLTMMR